MRNFAIRLIINAAALWVADFLFDGIQLTENIGGLLVVVLVFGLVNALIKPVLQFLSLPLTILSFGIFALVLNALLLMLVAWLTTGLEVNSFWTAFFASIVISIVSAILSGVLQDDKKK